MSKRRNTEKAATDKAAKVKKSGHWSQGLLAAVDDPELFIKSDDLVDVIKDKYPKAEHHFLVLAKANVPSLKCVTSEHKSLLEHMENVALETIKSDEFGDVCFKIGYHAEPSMSRLHLHVISDDMRSDCVKTKKHWNSFNTEFFLKSEDVRKNLDKNGQIILPGKEKLKELMDTPLKCHKCDFKPKHMPDLKKHILNH